MSYMEIINGWAEAEVAAWSHSACTQETMERDLVRLTEEVKTLFVYDISASGVTYARKPGEHLEGTHIRAEFYRLLLNKVVARRPITRSFKIGIDLEDEVKIDYECPIFTFQKRQGERLLLLPDVDILEAWFVHDFKNIHSDELDYQGKIPTAVFAGSTTGGGHITNEKLARGEVARIQFARFLQGSDYVDFSLPKLVQCGGYDVEAAIQVEGYSKREVSWPEQLRYRFLFSMDGNGATCSRIVQSLASNSALVKLKSDRVLYYFRGMEPWKHFLPVNDVFDLISIIDLERRQSCRFREVARDGRSFYEKCLEKNAILSYCERLLFGYTSLLARNT